MGFHSETNLTHATTTGDRTKHLKDTRPSRRRRFERAKSESTLHHVAFSRNQCQDILRANAKIQPKLGGSLLKHSSSQGNLLPPCLFAPQKHSKTRKQKSCLLSLKKGKRLARSNSEPLLVRTPSLKQHQGKTLLRHSYQLDSKKAPCSNLFSKSFAVDPTFVSSPKQNKSFDPKPRHVGCMSCSREIFDQPWKQISKTVGSQIPTTEAVEAALKLSEILDGMGFFDEDEENESLVFVDNSPSFSNAGHSSCTLAKSID